MAYGKRMKPSKPPSFSLVTTLIICQSPIRLVCNNIILLCCDNAFSKLSPDEENFADDRMNVIANHIKENR